MTGTMDTNLTDSGGEAKKVAKLETRSKVTNKLTLIEFTIEIHRGTIIVKVATTTKTTDTNQAASIHGEKELTVIGILVMRTGTTNTATGVCLMITSDEKISIYPRMNESPSLKLKIQK